MPYPESRTPGRLEVQEAESFKEAEPDPDGAGADADGEGSNHPEAVPDYVTAADGSDGEHDRHHEPQTEHNQAEASGGPPNENTPPRINAKTPVSSPPRPSWSTNRDGVSAAVR